MDAGRQFMSMMLCIIVVIVVIVIKISSLCVRPQRTRTALEERFDPTRSDCSAIVASSWSTAASSAAAASTNTPIVATTIPTGTFDNPSTNPAFVFNKKTKEGLAPKGGVIIKIIFFIMDLSASRQKPPAATPVEVRAFMSTTTPNLRDFFATCTMGNLTLDVEHSVVINVPYPTNATLKNGKTVSLTTCTDNVIEMQHFAEEHAEGQGISLDAFQHRILILPYDYHTLFTGCNFAGLSSGGRWDPATKQSIAAGNTWGFGYLWIGGISWKDLSVYAHEFGHNYSFGHAKSSLQPLFGNDIFDCMSSWGNSDMRCYSAPHMWKAGWSAPSVVLRLADLPRTVIIPVQQHSTSGTTGVYVGVDDGTVAYYALSYRSDDLNSIYEQPFSKIYSNKGVTRRGIGVHRMSTAIPSGGDTELVSVMTSAGAKWSDTMTTFSVTLVSLDAASATVLIS